ncbi:MAG: hypothetical protein AAGG01_07835, partial [Planctomycetota bacterium]
LRLGLMGPEGPDRTPKIHMSDSSATQERSEISGPTEEFASALTRSALPLSLLIAFVCAALSAGALFVEGTHGSAPDSPWVWALTLLSLPVILGGGAAIGPLLWVTPNVEPSLLKLGLFSSLLSPALVAVLHAAVLFGGAELGFQASVPGAWAITFGVIGVLSLLGARSHLSTAPAGRAAGLACLFGLAAAALALYLVQTDAGLAGRVGDRGTVAMTTLARSFQGGAPLAQPWTVGLDHDLRPALAGILAAVAGPAQASPLVAAGWVVAWSVAILAIAGYLASAALFRECGPRGAGLRDLVAAGALPAVCWIGDRGSWAAGTWLSAALTSGVLLAGLHAVRRGARPWPGLAVTLLCVLGALHPLSAFAFALALAATGALSGRWMLLPLVGFALLPGILQGRLFGGFGFDPSAPSISDRLLAETELGRLGEAVSHWATATGPGGGAETGHALLWLPVLVLGAAALAALVLLIHRGADTSKEDRRASRLGACLYLLAWMVPFVLVALLPPRARGEGIHLVGSGLLVVSVAAGRVAQVFRGRWAALGVDAVMAGSLVLPPRLLVDPSGRPATKQTPFKETVSGLEFRDAIPLQVGLGEALRFLRESEWVRDPMAVLLREPGTPGPAMRHEPLSLAPLLFQMPLFGARVASPGVNQTRWLAPRRAGRLTQLGDAPKDRLKLLEALYEREGRWHARFDRVLLRMRDRGHSLVFLVTEADRRATTDRGSGPRGVDGVIVRLGGEMVFEGPEVAVYVLGPEGGAGLKDFR